MWFQSTSSEEDVVSCLQSVFDQVYYGFNPRPPKRTLCQKHRRDVKSCRCFNPRPPKRTLCPQAN